MSYVYFRKDDRRFSHVSETPSPETWLNEFQFENASKQFTYVLNDDNTVTQGPQHPTHGITPRTQDEINLEALRDSRNRRLTDTDWWAVSDREMTSEQIAYRQALRDITKTYQSIVDVVWPEKP